MPRWLIPFAVCLVLAAGLAVSAVQYVASPQEPGTSVGIFPERLPVRVILTEDKLNEANRQVHYADDGVTVKKITVEYRDGTSGFSTYRPDGTVLAVSMFYAAEGNMPRQLRLETAYADDGEHLLWEKSYYEDGTLKSSGKRIPSGDYLVVSYQPDGTTMSGEAIYNRNGKQYAEFERHENGNFKKLVMKSSLGTETTNFSVDGLKMDYHKDWGDYNKVWEKYQADGKTLIERFELTSEGDEYHTEYFVRASYYNPEGTLNHERKITRAYMEVTVRDRDGSWVYQQRWLPREGSEFKSLDPADMRIIQIYLSKNTTLGPAIHFDKEGRVHLYVTPVQVPSGQMRVSIRNYHPDGSLKSWRRPDLVNSTAAEDVWLDEDFKEGERLEPFDYSILKNYRDPIPFKLPPIMPPEAQYYGP